MPFIETFVSQVKILGVRNYITYNSKHKLLIVSLPNEKIVVGTQVNISSDGAFIASSWFKLVGNGKSCVGNKACGDGGEAGKAKLAYPKVRIDELEDSLYLILMKQFLGSCNFRRLTLHC